MPCTLAAENNPQVRAAQDRAAKLLEAQLAAGTAQVVIGAQGSIAFKGWQDRGGLADLCAYRRLLASNSPALRRAVMRAEAVSGRKVDARAIAAGQHSHDGGKTWGTHT